MKTVFVKRISSREQYLFLILNRWLTKNWIFPAPQKKNISCNIMSCRLLWILRSRLVPSSMWVLTVLMETLIDTAYLPGRKNYTSLHTSVIFREKLILEHKIMSSLKYLPVVLPNYPIKEWSAYCQSNWQLMSVTCSHWGFVTLGSIIRLGHLTLWTWVLPQQAAKTQQIHPKQY